MVEHLRATIKEMQVGMMKEVFLALIAGMIVGMLFKFLKLPLPAPPVFSAVVGVFGVYFGGVVLDWILKMIQH